MLDKHRFIKDIEALLKKYSIEEYLDIPSFILADHIMKWLEQYSKEIDAYKKWKGENEKQESFEAYLKRNFKNL